MNRVLEVLHQIWLTKPLRDKVFFTIGMLVVFRVLAHVTIPGADINQIQSLLQNQSNGSPLGMFSLLTGGALKNFSVILMGLTPYINASIVMQLLTVIMPSLENLKKEGEAGQKKINQYTRLLTVPFAFLQSYGMMVLLNRFSGGGQIVDVSDPVVVLPMMLTVTAGTVLLVWLGEMISEKGIGNGISLLIFAGIVSTVPTQLAGAFQSASAPVLMALFAATVGLIIFVVYVSEAERRVPVIYSSRKSSAEQRSFLPLKINQAGMIPIIFAISIISFPSIMGRFFQDSGSSVLQAVATFSGTYLNPSSPTWTYILAYTGLIMGFTYFYVSIVFEPKKIAENIQKRSGYVPGYRPGTETEILLDSIMNRLAFWGGLFLASVAIFPMFFERFIGGGFGSISLLISGAGIIIVVSVVLDLIRQINSQLVMHDYNRL